MLLIIDNYDSFTYNLVQRIGELDSSISMEVIRNDQITVDEAVALSPTRLLLSPGPCTPTETGVCSALIERFKGLIPVLGVCLGHQTIAAVHGMTVRRHDVLMHGKTSPIHHDGRGIFRGLPNPFTATRYHSLIVDRSTLGGAFEVSAWTAEDEIMGLRWTGPGSDAAPLDGVQFHPESFLTRCGPILLANFLDLPAPSIDDEPLIVSDAVLIALAPGAAGALAPGAHAEDERDIHLVTDVVYATAPTDRGREHALTLDAAFPATPGEGLAPAVIYIHGGGYFMGSKENGRGFIRAMAGGGYFAVAINYRLADTARYPAAVHDCKAAVRFLRANAAALALDPDRIGVWGHSAGGHLSALVALSGDEASVDGAVGPGDVSTQVACAVCVSGPTDFLGPTDERGRRLLGRWFQRDGDELRAALTEATPMTWVDGDDPPMLIVHGELDRLVPLRHGAVLDTALRAAGVASTLLRIPDQGHLIVELDAYRAVAVFFDEHLGGQATSVVGRMIAPVPVR